MSFDESTRSDRRSFIGSVAAGTLALASVPLQSLAADPAAMQDDPWLRR